MAGRRFTIANLTLKELVAFAYELHGDQVTGGPAWLGSQHYTIVAEPEGELRPSSGQLQVMTQKLLADRFRLTFHREQRVLTAYVLAVGKNGSKLQKAQADATGLPSMGFRGPGRMTAKNTSMREFTGIMQFSVLDRPVLDRTGLSDKFDFELNWTPDETQLGGRGANAADAPNARPGLFTAIQEQLGLKLDGMKTPVEVLTIDRAEKPSEN